MSATCSQFRADLLARWLGGEPWTSEGVSVQADVDESGASHAALPHAEGCAECAAWIERQGVLVEAMQSLTVPAAPPELDALVASRVERDVEARTRTESALRSGLGRLSAPDELDRRVAAAAEDASEEVALERAPSARLLRTLTRHEAPSVLERLVDEELREPEPHTARRTAGELPRLAAPRALTPRVERELVAADRERRRAGGRSPLTPRAALGSALAAAAAVVLWVAGGPGWLAGDATPEEPSSRIRVTRVASIDDLPNPGFARAMANAMTGGAFEVSPVVVASGEEGL